MAFLKQGSQFLYDNTSGDIVGVKDTDSGEQYWLMGQYQPAYYKVAPQFSIASLMVIGTSLLLALNMHARTSRVC